MRKVGAAIVLGRSLGATADAEVVAHGAVARDGFEIQNSRGSTTLSGCVQWVALESRSESGQRIVMKSSNARFVILGLILVAAAVAACHHRPYPTLQLADSVDIPQFMGAWYVIACIPSYLERKEFNAVESTDSTRRDASAWYLPTTRAVSPVLPND